MGGFFKNRLVEGLTSEIKGLVPELEREGEAFRQTIFHGDQNVVLTPRRFVELYDRICRLKLRLHLLIYGEDISVEHPALETPERVSVLESADRAVDKYRSLR